MSGIRSNNPFAQEAEEEIQSHISNSNGLSRQSSVNNNRTPDPSILESSSTEAITLDGHGGSTQQNNTNGSSNNSEPIIPSIQVNQDTEPAQVDGGSLHGNSRRSSTSTNNNNSIPEWQQVDDSHPDGPPPAYSEVDPISPSATNQSSNLYQRPTEEPPRSPSTGQYERPSAPFPPQRPQIDTQFAPPPGPPPNSHFPPPGPPPNSFMPPPGPPPSHLSPEEFSPRLPPRPTSPRLPPRPNVPRRNIYPGASGASYSNIGAPPLPNRR